MIKSELIGRIASQNPHLYQRDIENIVNAIFDEIVKALGRGDRVELRDFGVFSPKRRGARTGRNPKTGAEVQVAQKVIAYFKTGKEMRARLNREIARSSKAAGNPQGLQCSRKHTRFSARGTSNGRLRSTLSGLDSSWPLETKPIHRTTSGFAATPLSLTCNFSSSMRWEQSACGFWWTTQTRSSANTVNGALSAIPTVFTIRRGGRANLPSTT